MAVLPRAIAEYSRRHDLELWSYPSAEAQAGAISDDIAYDAHDIDDGLRAEMFALDDIATVPLIGDILRSIDKDHPRIEPGRRVHELRRRLITRMIEDVIAQTLRNVAARGIQSAAAVRAADGPVVTFSPAMAEADRAIKGFLYPKLYRHERIVRIMNDAEQVVRDLFAHYVEHPTDIPAEWRQGPGDPAGRRAADRGLHRGHDRPLRDGRARPSGGNTPELR